MRTFLVVTLASLLSASCSDDTEALRRVAPPKYAADGLGWHVPKSDSRLYYTELSAKPPYYSGSGPVSYEVGRSAGGVLFFHRFKSHENDFVLNSSFLVTGARTVDEDGSLLAEARLRYFVDRDHQGHELEEFHYDTSGHLVFYCKSKIDPDSGFKTSETGRPGRKQRDYYSLWPVQP